MTDQQKIEHLTGALRSIKGSIPCNSEGMFFFPRHDPDGNFIADQPVDPACIFADIDNIVANALDFITS